MTAELWPEGNYTGTPIRVDMRGRGSVWFKVANRTVKIPLMPRRGMDLADTIPLVLKTVRGKEHWSIAQKVR